METVRRKTEQPSKYGRIAKEALVHEISGESGEHFTAYLLTILAKSQYDDRNIDVSEIIKGLKLKYGRLKAVSVLTAFEWGCTGLLSSIHKGELWPHHFIGKDGFIEQYKSFDNTKMPWI